MGRGWIFSQNRILGAKTEISYSSYPAPRFALDPSQNQLGTGNTGMYRYREILYHPGVGQQGTPHPTILPPLTMPLFNKLRSHRIACTSPSPSPSPPPLHFHNQPNRTQLSPSTAPFSATPRTCLSHRTYRLT